MSASKSSSHGIILVPIDFSTYSENALAMASYYARCTQHRLVVLHVVHDPGEMPGYYARMVKKKKLTTLEDVAAEALDSFLEDVRNRHQGNKELRNAEALLKIGQPVTQILVAIRALKPSLVVLGSQGRSGLSHALIGSKAEQCVRLSPVPVMLVKQGNTPPKF